MRGFEENTRNSGASTAPPRFNRRLNVHSRGGGSSRTLLRPPFPDVRLAGLSASARQFRICSDSDRIVVKTSYPRQQDTALPGFLRVFAFADAEMSMLTRQHVASQGHILRNVLLLRCSLAITS